MCHEIGYLATVVQEKDEGNQRVHLSEQEDQNLPEIVAGIQSQVGYQLRKNWKGTWRVESLGSELLK